MKNTSSDRVGSGMVSSANFAIAVHFAQSSFRIMSESLCIDHSRLVDQDSNYEVLESVVPRGYVANVVLIDANSVRYIYILSGLLPDEGDQLFDSRDLLYTRSIAVSRSLYHRSTTGAVKDLVESI